MKPKPSKYLQSDPKKFQEIEGENVERRIDQNYPVQYSAKRDLSANNIHTTATFMRLKGSVVIKKRLLSKMKSDMEEKRGQDCGMLLTVTIGSSWRQNQDFVGLLCIVIIPLTEVLGHTA